MQITENNSTTQSEFSESSLNCFPNSEQFVNFQQRFSRFNPESQNPHYNEFEQPYAQAKCVCRPTYVSISGLRSITDISSDKENCIEHSWVSKGYLAMSNLHIHSIFNC